MLINLNWDKTIQIIIALTFIAIAIAVVVIAFEIPVQWPKPPVRRTRTTY